MRPVAKFPDPDICRTIHDFADNWECLGALFASRGKCPHLRKIGANHYCGYPEPWNFAREDEIKGVAYDM